MTKIFFIFVMIAVPNLAFGQGHHPYAGLEQRTVKALSEQQIADLKAGHGMGLALPAELNGYPGPSHVLENADALGLSAEQRDRTKNLFDTMKGEAVPVGEQVIEQETKLDRLFADREITPATLGAVTEEIGATQARLRQIHLKYHLTMMDVLSPAQVERYRELRGYGVKADQLHRPHSQH